MKYEANDHWEGWIELNLEKENNANSCQVNGERIKGRNKEKDEEEYPFHLFLPWQRDEKVLSPREKAVVLMEWITKCGHLAVRRESEIARDTCHAQVDTQKRNQRERKREDEDGHGEDSEMKWEKERKFHPRIYPDGTLHWEWFKITRCEGSMARRGGSVLSHTQIDSIFLSSPRSCTHRVCVWVCVCTFSWWVSPK